MCVCAFVCVRVFVCLWVGVCVLNEDVLPVMYYHHIPSLHSAFPRTRECPLWVTLFQ